MSHAGSPQRPPVAVVGVSALFPGSTDSTGFWSDILAGKDLLSDVPESHWLVEDYYDPDPKAPDKTYARRGGFLSDIDFDAMGWGVPPSIIPATDTTQLLALIVAQRVLEDASKGQPDALDRSRMSVILGVTSAQELLSGLIARLQRPVWVKALREAGLPESKVEEACERIADSYQPWQESSFPGLLGNVVAGRIANRLDLGGTNCVTDAACASTFSALSMALNELYLGDSDMVITGGADTLNDIFMFMCFSKTPALSHSGDCRPFSDQADGTMLGEGLGMVALKRLEDAERDGDRIYAVIRGVGSSSDGRSKSVYAPVSAGQATAIRRAYELAGFTPESVGLVEAHGTGTIAGDAAEFGGLKSVFEKNGEARTALGSVKSQVGHCKAAAGAAGLFKAVMALHHKVLPPTIKIDAPNPKLEIEDSAFYLSTETRPWISPTGEPRRAGVSSFGFGGSNFHVAVEEYGGERAPRLRTLDRELVALCGTGGAEVARWARELAAGAADQGSLAHLAHKTQQSFKSDAAARLLLVAGSGEELAAKLTRAADAIEGAPEKAFSTPDGVHYGCGTHGGGLAFLFPGQGSQYSGMGGELAMAFDDAREPWDRAAAHDLPLHDVVFPRPDFSPDAAERHERRLTATEWAQPSIVCTSLSMLGLLRRLGIEAQTAAGHSLGEVTALHAAGVLSTDDVLTVARRRGELMAEMAQVSGAMVAVSASVEKVTALLVEAGEASGVVVANHNSPQQVVLSGPTDAIERVTALCGENGLRAQALPVSTAFHSPVVAAASPELRSYLGGVDFGAGSIPVYSNASAAPYEGDAEASRDRLAAAVSEPVRFVEMIEAMAEAGVRTFVEVGPGSVLGSLVDKILDGRDVDVVSLDRKGRHGVHSLLDAVARLAALGVSMDLSALCAEYRVPVDPAAVSKPKLSVPINGSNYGKPYPPEGGAAALPGPNPEPVETAAIPSPASEPVAAASQAPAAPAPVDPTPFPSAAPDTAWTAVAGLETGGSAAPAAALATQPEMAPALGESSFETPPAPEAPQVSEALHVSETLQVSESPQVSQVAPVLPTGWLDAWQVAQQQTAEVHLAFQRSMAESQTAFLQAAEASFSGLVGAGRSGVPTGAVEVTSSLATPTGASAYPEVPQPKLDAPRPEAPAPAAPAPLTVVPAPTAPAATVTQAPAPAAENTLPEPAIVAAPATGGPAPASSSAVEAPAVDAPTPAGPDFETLMLEVVAEKTGYPAEMLTLEMDLEADLGIDSIKRVEILAAFQEGVPGLPEIDPAPLGTLKTLGAIVEHMRSLGGVAAQGAELVAARATPAASEQPAAAGQPAEPSLDFEALMLEVVAEKTGYPAEMLNLEMDLEADLGIDSIKRVEILAAFQESVPGLPEIDPAPLGTLKTLGAIVEHMRSLGGVAAQGAELVAASVGAPTPTSPAPQAGPDLEALMLEVVAEKTGYPVEMLELGMELEAELGIDSIKRVEILAAFQERVPGLPEIDPAPLGTLKTLGAIVEHMRELGGLHTEASQPAAPSAAPASSAPSPAAAQAPSAPAQPASTVTADLEGLMLEVVAEKTGYPADMLDLGMELEAELGIDSIKRVEILAAFQERVPGLPEIDPAPLGTLKTLGAIVEHMRALGGGQDAGQPAPSTAPPTAPVPAAPSPSPAEIPTPAVQASRYALEAALAPALGLALPGLFAVAEVLVTGGDGALTGALVDELRARGLASRSVAEVPEGAGAVIFLGGLRPLADERGGMAVNHEAFRVARTLAPRLAERGGLFVTVQDTGGRFGLDGLDSGHPHTAWAAGLPALVKTAAQEWPLASLRAIDLETAGRPVGELARILCDELLAGGAELEVGLGADGVRRTPRSFEAPVERGETRLSEGDVVVVSGGARGVTAASMVAWARECRARFVLLGRTELRDEPAACAGAADDAALKRALLDAAKAAGGPLPSPADLGREVRRILGNREIRGTLAAIREAGGDARYLAVDVTDAAALGGALDGVRSEWGPVAGLVHGAGVLADRFIAELTDEQFDRVFETKVGGLRALLEATAEDPLEVICFFSSVAARCGNRGQAAYAMANEVLNKVAYEQVAKRPGTLVKSLGWGPWDGGMVSPELKKHFAARGVPLIGLEAGGAMLADELHGAQPAQIELVLGGEPKAEALLSEEDAAPVLRMDLQVGRRSHGYLAGHAIQGVPVVPVVLAVEWLARMARAYRPGLRLEEVSGLKVLRGIRLDEFDGGGHRIGLSCTENGDGTLRLEVLGADGKPHYRAHARMAEHPPTGASAPEPGLADLEAWAESVIYDGEVLFHGREFQVIDEIEGISDAGIVARLHGLMSQDGWTVEPWMTDVAALDGALQLAVLWARRMLGGATLPTSIGGFRSYGEGPPSGPLRCVVQSVETHASRTVSNITLLSADGERVAELSGVETHLRPDVARA